MFKSFVFRTEDGDVVSANSLFKHLKEVRRVLGKAVLAVTD